MPEFIIFANDLRRVSQAGFGHLQGSAFPEFQSASSHFECRTLKKYFFPRRSFGLKSVSNTNGAKSTYMNRSFAIRFLYPASEGLLPD